MARQSLAGAFAEAAFKLQPSSTSKPIYTDPPVKTQHGFHVIMCAPLGVGALLSLAQGRRQEDLTRRCAQSANARHLQQLDAVWRRSASPSCSPAADVASDGLRRLKTITRAELSSVALQLAQLLRAASSAFAPVSLAIVASAFALRAPQRHPSDRRSLRRSSPRTALSEATSCADAMARGSSRWRSAPVVRDEDASQRCRPAARAHGHCTVV